MDHSEYREEIAHGDHPLSYDRSEPRANAIGISMAVTTVLLIVVGIAVQQYYERVYLEHEYNVVLAPDNWALQNLRDKETWELTHYGYFEKEKGTVRIPIEDAMKLVARDAAANAPRYPSTPYRVKTAAELQAAGAPAVAPAGAAAANAAQNTGANSSSPNVQPAAAPAKH